MFTTLDVMSPGSTKPCFVNHANTTSLAVIRMCAPRTALAALLHSDAPYDI